jgi:hypothetical protein
MPVLRHVNEEHHLELTWIKSTVWHFALALWDPGGSMGESKETIMKTLRVVLLAASCVVVAPAFAQTAGNTPNTGPQGSGNFVAGQPEGTGTSFVAGKPEGEGTGFVKGTKENKGDMAPGKAR